MADHGYYHEAKTHLLRLLLRVIAGEEIVIAKAGKPIAKLVPIEPENSTPQAANHLIREWSFVGGGYGCLKLLQIGCANQSR